MTSETVNEAVRDIETAFAIHGFEPFNRIYLVNMLISQEKAKARVKAAQERERIRLEQENSRDIDEDENDMPLIPYEDQVIDYLKRNCVNGFIAGEDVRAILGIYRTKGSFKENERQRVVNFEHALSSIGWRRTRRCGKAGWECRAYGGPPYRILAWDSANKRLLDVT